MAIERLKVGEVVPLVHQMFDTSDVVFPRAVIKDGSGTILATKDLALIGQGLYSDRTYLMPDLAAISVQYFTFQDNTYTDRAVSEDGDCYSDNLDVFLKQTDASDSAIVEANIVGFIDPDDNELIGVVDMDEELVGFIDSDDSCLVGFIDDGDLVGFVDPGDAPLVGFIDCEGE